jgi:Protein of unknown function (DUF2939)
MKRLIALAVLLLVGFYVGWPAWSGYQIHKAIGSKNTGLLDSKIDFPSVRESLRPAVSAKINDGLDKFKAQAGPAGAMILSQLKGDMVPKIVDTTLGSIVNADTVMRIATEGGSFKENLEKIMREQMGRSGLPSAGGTGGGVGGGVPGLPGGLPGGGNVGGAMGDLLGKIGRPQSPVRDVTNAEPAKPAADAAPAGGDKPAPKVSFANIKTFRMNGPLSFAVGVAKDPAATEADVTAQMSFTGGDWKVTSLVPKL